MELKELTSAQLVDALYEDEIKVGLVRLPKRAPGIQFEPVFEERLVVAVPSGHVLEKRDRVSLEAIADLLLIFFTRHELDDGLAGVGDVPQVGFTATLRHKGFLAALRSPGADRDFERR